MREMIEEMVKELRADFERLEKIREEAEVKLRRTEGAIAFAGMLNERLEAQAETEEVSQPAPAQKRKSSRRVNEDS